MNTSSSCTNARDDACLCKDTAYITSVSQCFHSACTGQDLTTAQTVGSALCRAVVRTPGYQMLVPKLTQMATDIGCRHFIHRRCCLIFTQDWPQLGYGTSCRLLPNPGSFCPSTRKLPVPVEMRMLRTILFNPTIGSGFYSEFNASHLDMYRFSYPMCP